MMRYFQNTATPPKVYGFDDADKTQADLIANAVVEHWTEVTNSWPPPAPPADTRPAARAALDTSDRTIIRCYEHGVAVPAEWTAYRAALRSIVSGDATTTVLPTAPAYPAGT
jgi:hypothetical protein